MADTFNLSSYSEAQLFDHFLRSATFTKPTVTAFALCSGVPVSANTGANIPEIPNANGYARVNYAGGPINSGWSIPGADTAGTNNLPVTFPTVVTANWPMISGIAVLDSATYGAGNVLFWASVTTPRQPLIGDTATFNSGSVSVLFD